jgi:enoyl-CoA hydratase
MEDYKRIIYSAKPTIAQVHGYALADGLIYAVMCDYVIASDDAVFGNPEGRWGPVFSPFLAFTVPHTGLRWAVEVASTGRRFDASEAQRVGLINRVVPRADLDAEVDELARALSTITRDTMATGRAFLHWYHEMLGLSSALRMHVGITAADVNKTVADDEFDFGAAIEQNGLKAAIAERNRLYGGAYWGY